MYAPRDRYGGYQDSSADSESPRGSRPSEEDVSQSVRPVSARTWNRLSSISSKRQTADDVTMFSNGLFGQHVGDAALTKSSDHAARKSWASETVPLGSRNALENRPLTPRSNLGSPRGPDSPRPSTPSARMQQQLAISQQKRLQRLQSGVTASSGSMSPRRPGSARSSLPASPALSSADSTEGATLSPAHAFTLDAKGDVRGILTPTRLDAENASLPKAMDSAFNDEIQAEDQKAADSIVIGSQQPVLTTISDVRSWVMQHEPQGSATQCRIVRNRTGSLKQGARYTLFLDNGTDRYLLSACKRKGSKGSNYLISLDAKDMRRHSSAYCGKVRSNFLGTEFLLYDNGANLAQADPIAGYGTNGLRSELGAVTYKYNVMGTRGPRKMTVVVPRARQDGTIQEFKAVSSRESILTSFKRFERRKDMVVLQNRPPRWNEQLGAYCLNFGGRVTNASVKNFQLVTHKDSEEVILQFGKVGKETFTMDFRYPLSAYQAFAICLSSFDPKLACE